MEEKRFTRKRAREDAAGYARDMRETLVRAVNTDNSRVLDCVLGTEKALQVVISAGLHNDMACAAASLETPEMLRRLLDRGIPANSQNLWSGSLVTTAIHCGRFENAKLLLATGGVELQMSTLFAAVEHGDLEMVRVVLDRLQFDSYLPVSETECKRRVLNSAAQGSDEETAHLIMRELLDRWPEMLHNPGKLDHCLGYAAVCGTIHTVQLLLDSGANVSYDDEEPLYWAMKRSNNDAMIDLLLSRGAGLPSDAAVFMQCLVQRRRGVQAQTAFVLGLRRLERQGAAVPLLDPALIDETLAELQLLPGARCDL